MNNSRKNPEKYMEASRRAKANRNGEFFVNKTRNKSNVDYATCHNRAEMSVKDAIMRLYEQRTRALPDNEARCIARQLSQAFGIAGEVM